MNHNFLSAAILGAALAALPACAHHQPRVADTATLVTDPSFEGKWQGNEGRVATVTRSKRTGYSVTIVSKSSTDTYDVDLLDINGKRFVEIAVHQPTSKGPVPVYMYGRLDIKGNTITYRRLRAEWLEKTAKTLEGSIYKSTSEVQQGSGGIVVRDPDQMRELLEKAANDPTAFGEPDTAHRVK